MNYVIRIFMNICQIIASKNKTLLLDQYGINNIVPGKVIDKKTACLLLGIYSQCKPDYDSEEECSWTFKL